MIDLHTHVLHGLDDGAGDLDSAVAMCRAAAADGIQTLVATPHVRHDYAVTPERMRQALDELRIAVSELVDVLPGGEVDPDELNRPLDEILAFALGGNPSYLLLETPYTGWGVDVGHAVERLLAAGVTPVLAHPERNNVIQSNPQLLRPLVDAGALVQITAASIDGRAGRRASHCARALIGTRLVHVVASDAHEPHVRAIGLSNAVAHLADDELAAWLTTAMPRAILDGTELPTRPPDRPRDVFRRLLRR